MPLKLPLVLAAIAWTFALLVPSAKSDSGQVIWTAPTPADQSRITVSVGQPVSVTLTAAVAVEAVDVHIDVVGAPAGAVFNSSDGGSARATFEWTPQAPGDRTVLFTASTGAGSSAPARGILIHVTPAVRYPRFYRVGETHVARWATVWKRSVVRAQPSSSAPAVTTLETRTTDGTQNIVLVLDGVDFSSTETWYRVRLAILPNNSTGWVRGENLGRLFAVHTHLYVDLARMTATLKRDGATVFEAPVGIGRPASPTPRGEFYVRNKLAGFDDPFYGPVAFGTNARSAVLTDWPDGGFVGVHGTNRPALVPGRVSHGCIDLRNGELLRLARLMPVGTPLTIR
jgi:lipoprotein-anchoring transpeptidase ErfK/SrfK